MLKYDRIREDVLQLDLIKVFDECQKYIEQQYVNVTFLEETYNSHFNYSLCHISNFGLTQVNEMIEITIYAMAHLYIKEHRK